MDFKAYAQAFDEVREDFEETVRSFGIPFEDEESSPRSARAQVGCPHCDNDHASLWRSWISPACVACRTGEETATFFVSLKCTKDCYFCFNPNQEDYEYFRHHQRDIVAELEQAHAAGATFRHLAITGGEPFLHRQQVLAFVRRAKELYPGVHVRIYTSGDLLDDALLDDLRAAGLDELRFSVKPAETDGDQEQLFERMAAAVAVLPDVMVEMPVIPGTLDEMKRLLRTLDNLGVRGINLLEFCFPLCNAEEFLARGFTLRQRPYEVLYNYWYAGGLPIAGGETDRSSCCVSPPTRGCGWACTTARSTTSTRARYFSRTSRSCSIGASPLSTRGSAWTSAITSSSAARCSARMRKACAPGQKTVRKAKARTTRMFRAWRFRLPGRRRSARRGRARPSG